MTKQKRSTRDPDLLARLIQNIGLAGRLFIDRRVSVQAKLIPVVMVLYMISPIDLVPDFLLPFGIVDDLGAFIVGLQLFINSAPREVLNQYRGIVDKPKKRAAPGTQTRRASDGSPDDVPLIIDGQYEVRDEE